MRWTRESKLEAAIRAPMSRALLRPDTRVIERPGWYQLVTPSAPGSLLNEVIVSQVEAGEADRVIEEVIAMYQADGHPVKWCVGPWTRPGDFGERLARRGFSSWDVRGMVAETAATALAGSLPAGVVIEEISENSSDEYLAVMMRGWSVPTGQAAVVRDMHFAALRASPREAHFFAARVDGAIVATTTVLLRGDYGYLMAGQVLAAFRGRGIYRALVAARTTFLAERGIFLA